MKYHAMYIYELSDAAGVSRRTFRRWLAADAAHLRELGYESYMRLLPPQVVQYLCDKYAIILK